MGKNKKRFSYQSIIGGILCLIFIPVIFINLALIVSTYTKPGEIPDAFGIKPAIVLSGSMEPEIQVGDMIFLHKTDPARLKVGDVVCYLDSGHAITHRIAGVTESKDGQTRFVTQGDANNTADRLAVSPDQIQGIWRGGRIAGLGRIVMFMQSTTGMILFMVCPLCLFILWDIWRRRRLDREEEKRTAALESELEAFKSGMKAGKDADQTRT